MEVIGYNRHGLIEAVISGVTYVIPDAMENPLRQQVYEWEFDEHGERVNTIPPYVSPGITERQVDAERDRRIDAGFVFEGVHYQSRPEDRENIAGAKAAATDAITLFGAEAGNFAWQRLLDPNAPSEFRWIAADNSTHPMDAQTAMRFGYAALGHKQDHIFAARELKDMDTIPADFATNASYWP
ncbi:hypothetical protein [Agrobacterium sp. NPDC090273]|uniref:DUF4376 domain-containing protein n=1 Tax=Agrobacterium sp. NPDC090273 TaxID=3363919 RepID=UPI00383BC7F0